MRLRLSCHECPSDKDGFPASGFVRAELRDDGRYDITCSAGHRTIVFLTNEKYEVLFDMAAMAYLDGYSREAVATFAASLERFYEWGVRLLLLKSNIDSEHVSAAWSRVRKQSERQLGAFLFLHLLVFKQVPDILSETETGFRNKVVHEGYIPSESEVLKFAERVMSIILSTQDRLRAWAEGLDQLPQLLSMVEKTQGYAKDTSRSSLWAPMILNTSGRTGKDRHDSFSEALESLKTRRGFIAP